MAIAQVSWAPPKPERAYTPQAWQNWYAATQRPATTFAPQDAYKPQYPSLGDPILGAPASAYWNREAPVEQVYGEWLNRAKPKFHSLFKEYVASLPVEMQQQIRPQRQKGGFLSSLVGGDPSVSEANAAKKALLDDISGGVLGMPYNPENELANSLRDGFFEWLRATSLGGKMAPDNSINPAQREAWQQSGGDTLQEFASSVADNASINYRMNPEGRRQADRLADYNLLVAFQDTGTNIPAAIQQPFLGMGGIQNAISGATEWMFSGVTGIPDANQIAAIQRTPEATLRAVLTQDDYTRKMRQEDPDYVKRAWRGGYMPQYAAGSPEGLEFSANNPATGFGYATNWLTNPMMFPQKSEPERQNLLDTSAQLGAVTPVIEPSGDPAVDAIEHGQRRVLNADLDAMQSSAWKGVAEQTPKMIYGYNDAIGDRIGFPITPRYASAFVNDAAMMVPAMAGDPQNLAQLALTGGIGALAGGGIKSVVKPLLQYLQESPAELGYTTALSKSANPQSWSDYIFAPDPGVTLRTKGGKTPDPTNRQEYEQALADQQDEQKNILGRAGSFLSTQQRRAASKRLPSRGITPQ